MYHYTSCGLKNVYLTNGYHTIDTPYGEAVSIDDLEELHKVIALQLAESKPFLTGPEFRFLRKELGMTQASLASYLGNQAQSIALWEKQGRIPKAADLIVRILAIEYIKGNAKVKATVDRLNSLDRLQHENKMTFKDTSRGWRLAG